MDKKKLEALRRKYSGAKGGDIFDPEFAAVAAQAFITPEQRKWPFAGPATFLGAPFRPDALSLPHCGGIGVALIGVPMDLGVTNRAGARLGPRAVRAVERIGPYNHALRVAPVAAMKLADIGDVPFRSRYSLEQSIEDIEAFYSRIVAAGAVPFGVGGDHSVTYPILKALGRERPVGVVHIDAHFKMLEPFFVALGLVNNVVLIFIFLVRKDHLDLLQRIGWSYCLLAIPAIYAIVLVRKEKKTPRYTIFLVIFLAFLAIEVLYDWLLKIPFRETMDWRLLVPYVALYVSSNYGFVLMSWKYYSSKAGIISLGLFIVQIIANLSTHS